MECEYRGGGRELALREARRVGFGRLLAQMTPRIALGIAVMSLLVISTNRLLWRPLYALAERRTRLD